MEIGYTKVGQGHVFGPHFSPLFSRLVEVKEVTEMQALLCIKLYPSQGIDSVRGESTFTAPGLGDGLAPFSLPQCFIPPELGKKSVKTPYLCYERTHIKGTNVTVNDCIPGIKFISHLGKRMVF